MTGADSGEPPKGTANVAPETLDLRARPQPVTRINRKVVIGAGDLIADLGLNASAAPRQHPRQSLQRSSSWCWLTKAGCAPSSTPRHAARLDRIHH
jgi:hypothetical protein